MCRVVLFLTVYALHFVFVQNHSALAIKLAIYLVATLKEPPLWKQGAINNVQCCLFF